MKETLRQRKFNSLLQKELAKLFSHDKLGFLKGEMVTITEVRVSPDLGSAKIYISMTLVKKKEVVFKNINATRSEIRRILGNTIGKKVRIIPKLFFYVDETGEQVQYIHNLFDTLNIPPPQEENRNEDGFTE